MKVSILATESLGVRSLCCFVETSSRKYLIDPGIALDYQRLGLRPHPFQIARCIVLKKEIIQYYHQATDIIISHYHGDHCPLLDASFYQLDFTDLFSTVFPVPIVINKKTWYCKNSFNISKNQRIRLENLHSLLQDQMIFSEGKVFPNIEFSPPVLHGTHPTHVMMTCIRENDNCFVHASDIQLLHPKAIKHILHWKPSILLSSGPPIYLNLFSNQQLERVEANILKLSKSIPTIILDHHLLRSSEGIQFLTEIKKKAANKIFNGAEFMNQQPMLLEARREETYQDLPVSPQRYKDLTIRSESFEGYLQWHQWQIKKWS